MRPAKILSRCVIAAVIGLAIAASGLLDGPSDDDAAHQSYSANRAALQELQASAPASARREAAARQLCAEARGTGALARWTADGDLVCSAPSRPPSQITTLNHLKEARL